MSFSRPGCLHYSRFCTLKPWVSYSHVLRELRAPTKGSYREWAGRVLVPHLLTALSAEWSWTTKEKRRQARLGKLKSGLLRKSN